MHLVQQLNRYWHHLNDSITQNIELILAMGFIAKFKIGHTLDVNNSHDRESIVRIYRFVKQCQAYAVKRRVPLDSLVVYTVLSDVMNVEFNHGESYRTYAILTNAHTSEEDLDTLLHRLI